MRDRAPNQAGGHFGAFSDALNRDPCTNRDATPSVWRRAHLPRSPRMLRTRDSRKGFRGEAYWPCKNCCAELTRPDTS